MTVAWKKALFFGSGAILTACCLIILLMTMPLIRDVLHLDGLGTVLLFLFPLVFAAAGWLIGLRLVPRWHEALSKESVEWALRMAIVSTVVSFVLHGESQQNLHPGVLLVWLVLFGLPLFVAMLWIFAARKKPTAEPQPT